MSIQRNANMLVPVRYPVLVTGSSTQLTTTNEAEITVKELLIQAFSSISNQSLATATVANIVTALQTLP